ncbi:MAG: UDP-3-O-(3-hydroxymyristoyl)glucosamine N-acyltransferase [Arenicellales bacterium]
MRLKELAELLKGECRGESDLEVTSLGTLDEAGPSQITFLAASTPKEQLRDCRASAVILREQDASAWAGAAIIMENPHLGYARAARALDNSPKPAPSVHPTAVISPSATLGQDIYVGPNCVIEEGVTIGDEAIIEPGCAVGAGASIGAQTRLFANVTVLHGVQIGSRCFIKSGAVLGSHGFGNTNEDGRWVRIPQLGGLTIGNDVQIGAATTIDRGAIGDTVIADGVVIDNLVQIGHNVKVGEHTAIVSCVGIAGSVVIGKRCILAGAVGVADHVIICDDVHLTGMAMVTGSIDKPGMYSSGTGLLPTSEWRKAAVRFRQLDDLAKRIKALEDSK